jgi:hypothetical protein
MRHPVVRYGTLVQVEVGDRSEAGQCAQPYVRQVFVVYSQVESGEAGEAGQCCLKPVVRN